MTIFKGNGENIMQLFYGDAERFIRDTNHNLIANELKKAYFDFFGFNPSQGEEMSWRNSLDKIKSVFQTMNLKKQGVVLEYFLPSTSLRLDCMVTGKDTCNKDNAVIIELKQWQKTEACNCENEVLTYVGGGKREVLHPSFQVNRYQKYFEDFYEVFYDSNPIRLYSCAYLHNYNYQKNDPILDVKFKDIIDESPIFSSSEFDEISDFIREKISYGDGMDTLERINNSKKRPSKKLMDNVSSTIYEKPQYKLLDEQQVVYDKCVSFIKNGVAKNEHNMLIVEGGPGTGKSVIAINLLADLLRDNYWTEYVTGSKAFTESLRKIVKNNTLFKYTHQFSVKPKEDEKYDVLIIDEAHRLRKNSNTRFNPTDGRSQVEEIVSSSKVSVYFVDDNQIVRPGEIGSVSYIESEGKRLGCNIWKTTLEAQFRCSGNEGFVNWINNTLDIRRTANAIYYRDSNYDFRIFSNPLEMEDTLRQRIKEGNTARIVAGFSWPWTQVADSNGQLYNDVKIGDYMRPWNASANCKGLDKSIPKQSMWATQKGGFEQIGCIYTAQGFEFDYVGVIIGEDMVYSFDDNHWIGQPFKSYDGPVKKGEKFLDYVKDTYRVLLSRGIKGCYVFFVDKETEKFVKSRIK